MRYFIIALLTLFSNQIFSQGIQGKITDQDGKAIPYATLFVKEISLGTTSNSEGNYELKLEKGSYHIDFRSLGHMPTSIAIEVDTSMITKNIILSTQVFKIHEIRVYNKKEDPAYPIMRRAISMAPYYQNQIQKYHADVYIKGTAIMEKIPKLLRKSIEINAEGNEMKEGQLFVGENYSQIDFEAPNTFHQKIISSNMSMMDNQDDIFEVGLVTGSAYQPTMGDKIMPLSPQAFAHYKFQYEGYFTDGDYLINKIKIIPKRKSPQLYKGYIYVVDGLWNIHNIVLEDKQFFGETKIAIAFAQTQNQLWMPISHKIFIKGKLMGIKGKMHYTSSIKYNSVEQNPDLKKPLLLTKFVEDLKVEEEIKSKNQQKIEALMAKEELSNRDAIRMARLLQKESKKASKKEDKEESLEIKNNYIIEKPDSTKKRDSMFWDKVRPNPLTFEEQYSYQKSDSIQLAQTNQTDSTQKKKENKIISKLLLGGTLTPKDAKVKVQYNGLIAINDISFNAVEGWRYRQNLTLSTKFDSLQSLVFAPSLGYSFNRKQLQWKVGASWTKKGEHYQHVSFKAGNYFYDYNGQSSISPLIEMSSTLYFKKNFGRYFQQKFAELKYRTEITNGLMFEAQFGHYNRIHHDNITNYSWARKDWNYAPNKIYDAGSNPIALNNHISSSIAFGIEYTPRQRYSFRKGIKYKRGSKWPTFSASYKKGLKNIWGSTSNYDFVDLGIKQKIKLGVFSQFSYRFRGGYFLNNENIEFADYAKINTSPVAVNINSNSHHFNLLPYYTFNTNEYFTEAHATYTSSYLFLKFLPWLSERMWDENLHFSYLNTSNLKNYMEVGYSLGNILFMADVGVYCGFENGKYQSTGIRVNLKM